LKRARNTKLSSKVKEQLIKTQTLPKKLMTVCCCSSKVSKNLHFSSEVNVHQRHRSVVVKLEMITLLGNRKLWRLSRKEQLLVT
jgi:hypothetical protein